jgi:hypothetical protein
MKRDKESILREFIECGIVQGDSTLTGDYKTGNKAARKIGKIFELMEQDTELADYLLKALLWHENSNVKCLAASHALKMKMMTSEAIAVLRQVARKDTGIIGFGAEMALKRNGITVLSD